MQRHGRLIERTRKRLVGLRIILWLEFGLRSLPQRARRIDLPWLALFGCEFDRELDVIGIGANDALDLEGRYFTASAFRYRTMSVPREGTGALSVPAGAISKPEPPDDDQVQASCAPARRLVTTMRSATMKAE
jgi:hypothetical protein